MGTIYKLDFSNGKSYIGQTRKTTEHRYKQHLKNAISTNLKTVLYNAWRKYGPPKIQVLAIVENYEIDDAEIRAIKTFNTLTPNGYNTTEGGEGGVMALEVRQKLSHSLRNSQVFQNAAKDPIVRARKSASLLASMKFQTAMKNPIRIEKLSASIKIAVNIPEVRERHRAAMVKIAPVISASLKAKWKEPGYKERLIEAFKISNTPEVRLKKSIGMINARAIQRERAGLPPLSEVIETILRLRKAGMSLPKIGESVGMSHTRIYKILKGNKKVEHVI